VPDFLSEGQPKHENLKEIMLASGFYDQAASSKY
jgi:hypothetical protein